MDAIASSSWLEEAVLLQPACATSNIGMTTRIDSTFTEVVSFKLSSSDKWGCAGIIRVPTSMDERHLTDTRIGKIAYIS
jgi:hypothetical protein